MKKIIILSILILSCWSFAKAQYVPNIEDLLIDDIYPAQEFENINDVLRLGTTYNFYNDFKNWIPYCNSETLKNPPITYIEISFHVFLDNNGQNNNYTNTQEGRDKLLYILDVVNRIYSGNWEPSDPVSGVVELPNYDTRIRFTLGDSNERIYFYNNTTQNHGWNNSSFYNYVQTNFPSRVSKLNVFLTAGYYQGKVNQSNIVITNGGSGYTSTPSITFNPYNSNGASATAVIVNGVLTGINIINGGSYKGFSPPQITISGGGGGSGATAIVTKLSGGATGISNMPLTDLSTNHHVVMYHCHESNDWIFGMTLAHELAHNLGLMHTYCGGGATVVCCSGSCGQGCTQNCTYTEYLSDIFGNCPGTCPHIANWGNPNDNTIPNAAKITNNVMGGSDTQVYFSPMQAGQMHRTLALKSTRKYVKTETYSTIPLVINNDETWNFNLKLYRDVNISSGAILTISDTFELPYNGTLTINNGAALLITGTLKLSDINKIIVKNGGTIKFSQSSNLQISGSGKIEVQSGGYFCIESGSTITLSDFNSVINLRNGYINGVNINVLPSSTCVSTPTSYTTTGNGSINTFSTNNYIQNQTFTINDFISGFNIFAGTSVTTTKPQGPVIIQNGANVVFDADGDILLDKGFEVQLGGSFEAK